MGRCKASLHCGPRPRLLCEAHSGAVGLADLVPLIPSLQSASLTLCKLDHVLPGGNSALREGCLSLARLANSCGAKPNLVWLMEPVAVWLCFLICCGLYLVLTRPGY